MKECNKQVVLIPLPNGKFPLTETGIITAQEDGFKCGWRTALKWVLDVFKQNMSQTEVGKIVDVEKMLKNELEGNGGFKCV